MPSDPLPTAADLQASIEQLIASAVQTSRTGQDERLATVLRETLRDIEAQQVALAATAARIKAALAGDTEPAVPVNEPVVVVESTQPAPVTIVTSNRGPHELDIIAHGATLSHATGLQSLLRGMSSVAEVQTRQFVNGELRLHARMQAAPEIDALASWLASNGGTITTETDAVLEINLVG